MKDIPANRENLLSLIKHVKAGKKICALCDTARHVTSFYGYLITEAWHMGIDATVIPPLPSTLPSNAFSKLPSALYKLVIKDAGEIIFTEKEAHMALYEGHVLIRLVSKLVTS